MDVTRRYINVISLFQGAWYLPRHVVDKGVAIFERLGTPEYESARERFYAEHEENMSVALPGNRFNRSSDDPATRLLGRMGVHLTDNGTAVVPVHGVIAKRMSDFNISEQGISSDMLADTFTVLADAGNVRGVVLDVSSPGGSVLGVEGAAQALDSLRDKKPVDAIANEVMASGAYYIASHVNNIFVAPTSYIGSIGVYTTRIDETEFWENKGIKVDVISRGEFKTDRHPDTKMTTEERARIQQEVDTYYDLFINAVMRGRGITRAEAESLGDGSLEIGRAAIERGFADAEADLSWTVDSMDQKVSTQQFGGIEMNIFGKSKEADGKVEVESEDNVGGVLADDMHEEADKAQAAADLEAEKAEMEAERKRIEEREQALIEREVKADFDDLIKSGQILPKQRAYLENLALNLRMKDFKVSVPVEDAEEDDVHGAYEALMSALMVGVPVVEYSEVADPADAPKHIDTESVQGQAEILLKVQKKEGLSTVSDALAFVKENGIPDYAVNGLE